MMSWKVFTASLALCDVINTSGEKCVSRNAVVSKSDFQLLQPDVSSLLFLAFFVMVTDSIAVNEFIFVQNL